MRLRPSGKKNQYKKFMKFPSDPSKKNIKSRIMIKIDERAIYIFAILKPGFRIRGFWSVLVLEMRSDTDPVIKNLVNKIDILINGNKCCKKKSILD